VSLTTVQSQITGNAATAYSNATTYSSNATVLSSGTVPTARLASGTANSSTYLRGDQSWAVTGTVTSVATGTGISGGPITTTGTISLATAGAGAATYSSGISAITVDAYGRVSSVSGSAGYVTSSGVTSITAGGALSGGTITSTGTISLATIGSSASYSSGISAISIDAYGRVTSVTGSAGYVTTSGYGYGSTPTFGATTVIGNLNASSLTVYGAITASGDITAYVSDKRLKTNITLIPNALAKIKAINGVTYNFNDVAASFGYADSSRHVGVIAQEIETVLPEVVKLAPFDIDEVDGVKTSRSGENYKTVQYEKIIPLLIEAIKELSAEVEALKKSTCNCGCK
jgi:hypothetical protein